MAKKSVAATTTKTKAPVRKASAGKVAAAKGTNKAVLVGEVMSQLKALANETMLRHNTKYGANDNQFGVKHGDLRVVAKQIKTNPELAFELWKTGNADAQLLATLLLKPADLSAGELEKLVQTVNFSHVADWLHSHVTKENPEKETLRQKWMSSKDRWCARAGWRLTAGRVAKSPEGLDLAGLLDRIESEMGKAAPEVQWTMNECLAAIGINHPKHRKRALAIGEKLGVYRDYPCAKGCTSPFAPIWINEMVKRQG